jgi:hypothetical protein
MPNKLDPYMANNLEKLLRILIYQRTVNLIGVLLISIQILGIAINLALGSAQALHVGGITLQTLFQFRVGLIGVSIFGIVVFLLLWMRRDTIPPPGTV